MKKEIKLNVAISILVVLVVSVATLIELVSSTNALKTSLTKSYLENNYHYTEKLAEAINYVTSDLERNMIAVAKLSGSMNLNQNQLDILYGSQNEQFSSIFLTDANGVIQLMSPKVIEFKDREKTISIQAGTKISSDVVKRASTTKKSFISQPYISASGTLLILVTAPVLNDSGEFEGMMVGTLYMEEKNVINTVLNPNKYHNGSYVYAVDQNGRIIYHPNEDRIFEDVSENLIVKKLRSGESGYQVTNENGKKYFAGYSYIENLGWGVILHTPATKLDEPFYNLVRKIIFQSMAILIILLLFATFFVKRLTNPLTKLAEYSEKLISSKKLNNPHDVLTINSRIYEINQLYRRMRIQLLKLNQEIQLDGLTGLANRKTFDAVIKDWSEQQQPFAFVMIDIDNFKSINDTYGHQVGDDVIKFLASILISFSREDVDLCFRYGGEEFGLLLKGLDEMEASVIIEQFRMKIASMQSPTRKPITVSVGITSLKENDVLPKVIIERADKALYHSKQAGKNRVTVYEDGRK